ncbi:MAG: sugar phosphate isomerase/epimerase [Clostridiales bacterium]|nr:sugar phosphate isomerase/epimerase [Clostridiales bacterium]
MIKLSAFSDEAGSSLKEQISALKRNGISLMELRSIAGKNVAEFTEEEAKAYQKELEENGISVWSIGSPLGKVDIDVDFSEYCEKVRHVCKLANIFKAQRIRMFSFFNAYEKEEKVFAYLQEMVKIGKEYGVDMCHENEKDVFGDTVERVLKIMQNVDGLKYVYDPANYLQCGQSAEETLATFHAKTDYFHIKEVIASTGELVPAGYGDGKIKELVAKIDSEKVLTLEPHLMEFDAYKSIDNTEMKHKFTFANEQEAFDAAVVALKNILKELNYKEEKGEFVK